MRRLVPLLATLAALLAGCSDRQRLNPLDPGNPNTRGAPTGFAAVAGDGFVSLSWDQAVSPDVTGYLLERGIGTSPSYDSLALVPRSSLRTETFFDSGLVNGVDVHYRVRFHIPGVAATTPAEDVATPGAVRPWVADFTAQNVVLIAPDGRRIAFAIGGSFLSPADLDVDPASNHLWICDSFAGRLVRVSTAGGTPDVYGNFQEPVAVAVDHTNGRAWACDDVANVLQCFDPAGLFPTQPVVTIDRLATPIAVAVDPADQSVWVCERTGDAVRHIGPHGEGLGLAHVIEPSRVAVDSLTHRVWVTSFNHRQLTWFQPDGSPIDSITSLAGPIGVAIDPHAGRVWVADAGGSRVLVYDRNGAPLFQVPSLGGVREIGLDAVRGEAWATLPPTGEVARIGPAGTVIRRLGGMQQPLDIAVDSRP